MSLKSIVSRHMPIGMQDQMRSVLDRVMPGRRRAIVERRRGENAERALAAKVSPDGVVLAGPFTGMRIPPESSWGSLPAYLSGNYESQLHRWVKELVNARPPVVIDVCAAEDTTLWDWRGSFRSRRFTPSTSIQRLSACWRSRWPSTR